jgi:hypothetical protein
MTVPPNTLVDFGGAGFPNHFFCDSWAVGFLERRPWLAGRRIGEASWDVGSSRFWIGWVTKHGDLVTTINCTTSSRRRLGWYHHLEIYDALRARDPAVRAIQPCARSSRARAATAAHMDFVEGKPRSRVCFGLPPVLNPVAVDTVIAVNGFFLT